MKSSKVMHGVYNVSFEQVDQKGHKLEVEITVQKCYERNLWIFSGYVTRNGFEGRFPEYLMFTADTKKEIMEYLKDCHINGFDY